MDRTSFEDAIVDYLISAEALLLKDAGGSEDRGELGFRLALRGSLLLEASTGRDRRRTFKLFKRAYDLRSRVAHGGSLDPAVSLDAQASVPLSEFVNELGHAMRDALRAAVHLYAADRTFATTEYWDTLILGPAPV
jgi:hypothetical protein